MKKLIFCLLLFMGLCPIIVSASANSAAKVGDKYYDNLEDAIAGASSTDTISLISDVKLDDSLSINKTVNINLNGNDVTAPSNVFDVKGGVLNVSGKGVIKETEPNYGAIRVLGSSDSSDSYYSVVNVGKDVTLEGWSGIFITHDNSKAYGIVVNLEGKINSVNDTNGDTGVGVYVNGNIKHQTNEPIVNIKDGAEITSTGAGLYIAGNATFNIGKAYIEGDESGIGIKAGKLNIDGASVISEGEDKTPTSGYNDGIKASGTSIQIESNSGYAGNMDINIDSGTFRSKNSNVIYEYIGKGSSSLVDNIDISGGTFKSDAGKSVFNVSDSFKGKHTGFISGGKYSSDPSSYLKSGYSATLDNGLYNVVSSTSRMVVGEGTNTDDGNGVLKTISIVVILVILGVFGYVYRDKIFGVFRRISVI